MIAGLVGALVLTIIALIGALAGLAVVYGILRNG